MPSSNVTRQLGQVSRQERADLLGHRGAVIWLTGLSGSGKSTLAYALERRLVAAHHAAYVLDGDNLRHGLCADLGFSPADREENIRRVGRAAALFADAGVLVIAAFISPYQQGREQARAMAGPDQFIEVYLDVPLAVCEQRDPKGLYQKARAGLIRDFTGLSAPYEIPTAPDLTLDTEANDVSSCVDVVIDRLTRGGFLRSETESRGSPP